MKHLIAGLLILSALTSSGRAAAQIEKPALLLVPETISLRENLNAIVAFRWDEDMPVTLDTWSHGGRLSTLGAIEVFDEKGNEVPQFHALSMPLIPTGKKEVKKGELLKIGLYLMESVLFPGPGNYYAVATFSNASSGGTNVRFTTKKCWFHVTNASPVKA